jgi:hypothetical protein
MNREEILRKNEDLLFCLEPLPILDPMLGIEACDAGILSNQA